MQWRGLPPKTRFSSLCYHAEFGRSALKGVDINTGEPQNWRALELRSVGVGLVADPQDTRSSPC